MTLSELLGGTKSNLSLTIFKTATIAAMPPGRACSRAELLAATGISEADWSWAIRQLKEGGQVVQVGEKRGARYHRT